MNPEDYAILEPNYLSCLAFQSPKPLHNHLVHPHFRKLKQNGS